MSIASPKDQSLAERAVFINPSPHPFAFIPPSLYIPGESHHNNWLQMYLLDFIVRKINNKTNFNQRDQYKNYSTFLLFHGMLLAQFT